jgi:ferric-dicitrate binding protein FerR (iron transport regulator)
MELTKDILNRFFTGKYSKRDYCKIHEAFSNEDGRQRIKALMETHWMDYDSEKEDSANIERMLHQLQHRIYLEESRKIVKWSSRVQKIAAILFLPLLLSFMIYVFIDRKNKPIEAFAEIRSPLGGKTFFTLPDGSTGCLNNGSALKYPVSFAGNRQVRLKGEAFFDVARNGTAFHVLTEDLDVEVMGTTFNVSAYGDDQSEKIILQSGKVLVSTVEGKKLAILDPDQQLTYGKESRQFQLSRVNAFQFTAWTEGKLVFRNETLDEVVKRLSRWYNADFEITDRELVKQTFHATFQDEPLDEVLKLLSLTTPIRYEEVKRNIQNGEIQGRRKVILKLDKSKVEMFH